MQKTLIALAVLAASGAAMAQSSVTLYGRVDTGIGIRTGQKVFHTKFGEGKVLALEGAGADARAQVSFSRHGVKWLALSVAKLTPVDD